MEINIVLSFYISFLAFVLLCHIFKHICNVSSIFLHIIFFFYIKIQTLIEHDPLKMCSHISTIFNVRLIDQLEENNLRINIKLLIV